MFTRRFLLNLNLEIQSSPGITFILTKFLFLEPSNSALLWPYLLLWLIYQYSWEKEQQWWPIIEKGKQRHRVLVRWPSIVSFLFILMQLFLSSYWDPFLPSKGKTLAIFSMELHSWVLLKSGSVFQLVCPLWAAETGSGALTLQSAWKTEMDRLSLVSQSHTVLIFSFCCLPFTLLIPTQAQKLVLFWLFFGNFITALIHKNQFLLIFLKQSSETRLSTLTCKASLNNRNASYKIAS